MGFDFTGKKVLVTGAGSGIGKGIALALAKAGCKVYVLDKNQESLEKLTAENPNFVPLVQNLENWDETRAAVEKLEVLDGLVNNAGILLPVQSCLDQTKEEMEKYMAVDLFAYINCMQVVAKKMITAGRKGSIVNIASVCGINAWPLYLGYGIAKAGVDMATKQFALELGKHNIRVNSVNPTLVLTEIMDVLPEGNKHTERCVERMPIPHCARVEDVAGSVMYLLSDYSAMVTGTTHLVDGGLLSNISVKGSC